MMDESEGAGLIADYVNRTDHVTFAELQNRFGWMKAAPGELAMEIGNDRAIFWAGVSPVGGRAIQKLLDDKSVSMWTTSELVYLVDGAMIKNTNDKRIWVPVQFRPPRFGVPNKVGWLMEPGNGKERKIVERACRAYNRRLQLSTTT